MRLLVLATQLGWRNLWRNYRRTMIMLAAIVLGTWSMIFMTALMRGMVDQMIRGGLRVLPGHVQIHHPAYRDDPTVSNIMPPPSAELARTLDHEAVITWATRVRVPAVITSERDTRGVTLLGIDPERERGMSFVSDDVTEGRDLESTDDKGLLVGRKMLERLETDLGKRVVVMSQDPDNNIAERGFRIVGVFDSELEAQEEGFIVAGERVVQEMLGIGDGSSELAVLGPHYRDVDEIYQSIAGAAGSGLEVKPWFELDTLLGSMMNMMDGFVLIFVGIIFIALAFGLVNTLVMAVFERTREIGLMLALGVGPRNIVAQVMAEAVLLLALGLAVGNVVAWLTVSALSGGIDLSAFAEGLADFGVGSVIYPALTTRDVTIANVVVMVLGFLASISPAVRASRLEPVQALTEE
jgi:ABC-type lipoprotein release transport system permease subunit